MPGSVFEVVTLYLKNTSVKHKLARAQSGREDTSVMTDKQVLPLPFWKSIFGILPQDPSEIFTHMNQEICQECERVRIVLRDNQKFFFGF